MTRRANALGHPGVGRDTARRWGRLAVATVVVVWTSGLFIGFERSLAILVAAAVAVTILGLARPALGLIGLSALCTLEAVAESLIFTGGLWRWNTVNYWLLFVTLLFAPFVLRLRDAQSLVLKAFVVLLSFELLWTPDLGEGVQQVLDCTVLFGMIVYFARASDDRESWYWQGVISGTIGSLGGLIFYLQMDQLPFINANAWAYFPLTGVFACSLAGRFAVDDWKRQSILSALATVNAGWVLLSGSRGGILTALCCLALFVISFERFKQRVAFVCSVTILAAVIGTLFASRLETALGRVEELLDSTASLQQRTSGRSDVAAGAWQMFRANPFGIGTGGFAVTWATLHSVNGQRLFYRVGVTAAAHAGWMKTLAENGIIGFVVLAAYVSSFAVSGWRHRQEGLFVLGAVAAITLAQGFTVNELSRKGLWLFASGVTVLLNRDRLAIPVLGRRRARAAGLRHAASTFDPHDQWCHVR